MGWQNLHALNNELAVAQGSTLPVSIVAALLMTKMHR
jgi:hypothetical protein